MSATEQVRAAAAKTGEWPDESKIVTEDGKAADNVFSEKQMRLLTEPLYSNWTGPKGDRRFVAMANVGLFYSPEDALVPDVMLSVNVLTPSEFYSKKNRSYFVWNFGKPPDVVIEVVSNNEGGEDTTKPETYARWGVPCYVIFDPCDYLGHGSLRLFSLVEGLYHSKTDMWFENVGLGLTLWHGAFEGWDTLWLRWCDQKGEVIATGAERADKLLALLKENGINPSSA
jgi:Uma2 family endonuclease